MRRCYVNIEHTNIAPWLVACITCQVCAIYDLQKASWLARAWQCLARSAQLANLKVIT